MSSQTSSGKRQQAENADDIDVILNDFGRNLSGVSGIVFYGMALIVASVPLWLYWRIHLMDPLESYIPWAVMSLVSAFLIAKAYTNTKFVIKHRVAQKIERAVTKEVNKMYDTNKTLSKKERENLMHWKKNEICESQAVSFSLFYNNIIYLTLILVFSFFILKSFTPLYNYVGTVGCSSALLFLLSTSSK